MGRYIPELSDVRPVGVSEPKAYLSLDKNCMKISSHIANPNKNIKKDKNIGTKSSIKKKISISTPLIIRFFSKMSFYVVIYWSQLLNWIYLKFPFIGDFLAPDRLREQKSLIGFASLNRGFEWLYFCYIFRRIRDGFEFSVCSQPGEYIEIQKRTTNNSNWTFEYHKETYRAINMGSYNYLGFAEAQPSTLQYNLKSIQANGLGCGTTRAELPSHCDVALLENRLAAFLGTEAALVVPQGFSTNALSLPALADSKCCLISDALNHASLVLGCRLAGPTIMVFAHNDLEALERRLWQAVKHGNPKDAGKPFEKIIIVVEGIYSMEGSVVPLEEIIRLKNRFHAYLYLDEAHSIGAMGCSGRGVVDHFRLDVSQIDVLMGTFTKSFASSGGYIAGKRTLVDFLRQQAHSFVYGAVMSPVVCAQILSALQIIDSPIGLSRIRKLARNTRYFRAKLHQAGLIVLGDDESPVVPVLVLSYGNLLRFSRLAHRRGLATAVVGFPAVKLSEARIRFCMSAAHSMTTMREAVRIVTEIAEEMRLCFNSSAPLPGWISEYQEPASDEE